MMNDIYDSRFALWFAPRGEHLWAVTIGPVTFYSVSKERVNAAWRAHEECHKRQWRRYWYVGFAALYLWYQVRHGYNRNPLEIEARMASRLLNSFSQGVKEGDHAATADE